MITIFTTPSCSSCRKAKKWLEDFDVKYREKNLMEVAITEDDINMMLKNTENGFEDIISKRSKVFNESDKPVEDMTVKELKKFIIQNPSILKRPIIVDDSRLQVGYNVDDIRVFIPKKLREVIMCNNCVEGENCDYQRSMKKYFQEIREDMDK